METNNDIGAALKHKLDGFKDRPDDFVWNNIEAQLKQKKKRRLIVLWFSGLGLSLLFVLLWINNPFQNTITNKNLKTNPIVIDNHTETSTHKNSHKQKETNEHITISEEISDALITSQSSKKDNITRVSISEEHDLNTTKTSNNLNDSYSQKNRDNTNSSIKKYPKANLETTEGYLTKQKPNQLTYQTNKTTTKKDSVSTSLIKTENQDSIPKLEAQTKLTSNEKTKDSIEQLNSSRWSVTPQLLSSYYGAFSSKSNNNFNINYGILLSYRVTNQTFLRIGVRSLNLKQTIDQLDINLDYLEIPLDIKYTPFDKKLNPYFTGGLSYFLLQESTINNQNTSEYNTTFSLHVGFGIEHKIYNSFYINLESNFNYQIRPISENNNINPFILSINTGIEYRF